MKHMQKTAQRFEDESAFSSACFFTLEDEIVQYERQASRLYHIRNNKAFINTGHIYDLWLNEQTKRQSEDIEVLDTVIQTQQLLQDTILMHFGSKAEAPIVMEKLNERMEMINNKKEKLDEITPVPPMGSENNDAPTNIIAPPPTEDTQKKGKTNTKQKK